VETPDASPTSTLPTQTPEPTPIAFEDLPGLVMAAIQPEAIFTSVSPDGNWQVDIIRYDCVMVDPINGVENAHEQLIVTRLSDGAQTIAAEQFQYCGGLGAWGLNDRYWSSNSHYFYFDEARWSGPDGMACGLWHPGFSRVNVETGQLERLSGNGTMVNADELLYTWQDDELIILDLNGDELLRTPMIMENYFLQSLQMSPSGDRVVYVQSEHCNPTEGRSVVVLFTLENQSQTILVESDAPGHAVAIWETDDMLLLWNNEGNEWNYNLQTNELIPIVLPTP
jgi:hypothetical protein